MVVSESSFGVYLCLRRPAGLHRNQRSCERSLHEKCGKGGSLNQHKSLYLYSSAVRPAVVLFFVLLQFVLAVSTAYFPSFSLFPTPIDRVSSNGIPYTWAVGLAKHNRRRFDPRRRSS